MEKKTTFELLQRLKRIEIEKWNLGIETTQIMEELWRRVDVFENPKELVKEVKDESKNNKL